MSDYTEVSNTSWFSRIRNAIMGTVFGLLLTVVSVGGLFWNEGRAVKRYNTLKEGEGLVISVDSGAVSPENEGKLIHLSDTSSVDGGPVKDVEFGVSEDCVKLRRDTEIYQWVEKKHTKTVKTTGGGSRKETSYSYDKKWVDSPVSSSNFKQSGHENRGTLPYKSEVFTAETVKLGAFRMAPFLISKLNRFEDLAVASLDGASEKVKTVAKLDGNTVYFGQNPGDPQIGDVKVEFSAVQTGPVSVVAQQTGSSFSIYKLKDGTIELLAEDTKSAEEMFVDAHTSNKVLTWGIRFGGFVLMGVGIGLLLKPLSVVADFIPFIGNLVGAGTAFVSMILSAMISFVTIAIAWVFYRPFLGISLLVLAVVLLVWLIKRVGQKKAEAAQMQTGYAGSMGAPPPLD